MSQTAGTRAYKAKSEAFAAERKRRQKNSAAQKKAREALAYPEAPRGLTPEALVLHHQSLRTDFYRRQNERRAAA